MTKLEIAYCAGSFIAGIAVGAVVGIVILKHKQKKDAEEELSVCAEDSRAEEREGRSKIIAEAREKLMGSDDSRKVLSSYISEAVKYGGSYQPPETLESYLASRESPPEDEPDDEDEEQFFDPPLDDEVGPPYPISEDDFSSKRMDYDKLFLRYYLGDGALCEDENDELIADPESYIGDFAIDLIPPGRLLWFRVPDMSCDIEITVHSGSYHEEVLGMTDKEWTNYGGLEGYLADNE